MIAALNKDFVYITATAHVIFEFLPGDQMTITCVHQEAETVASRYALDCPDTDIIVDIRKLNARPKADAFDKFWAKISELVENRVNDRRRGDTPVANLYLQSHQDTNRRTRAPTCLKDLGGVMD
jgi:hypothetical protein